MLQLIPITSSDEEEDSSSEYLKKEGFDEVDIKIIKEHFDKEGIRYCIKTFKGISIETIYYPDTFMTIFTHYIYNITLFF